MSGKFSSRRWISKEIAKICEKKYERSALRKGRVLCFKPTKIFEFIAKHRKELPRILNTIDKSLDLIHTSIILSRALPPSHLLHGKTVLYEDGTCYTYPPPKPLPNQLFQNDIDEKVLEYKGKLKSFFEIMGKTSGEIFMVCWCDKSLNSLLDFLSMLHEIVKFAREYLGSIVANINLQKISELSKLATLVPNDIGATTAILASGDNTSDKSHKTDSKDE